MRNIEKVIERSFLIKWCPQIKNHPPLTPTIEMNPIQDFFAFKEDLKKGLTPRLERFKTGYGPGLVSVVLPFYNQAYLLGGSIESVFQQTYPNPELIVVNDGFTDEVILIDTLFLI